MDIQITKQEALDAYEGNGAALGRDLGVSRQAVSAMPDGPLDEKYALKLFFVLKPDVFQRRGSSNDPGGDPDDARIGPPEETA